MLRKGGDALCTRAQDRTCIVVVVVVVFVVFVIAAVLLLLLQLLVLCRILLYLVAVVALIHAAPLQGPPAPRSQTYAHIVVVVVVVAAAAAGQMFCVKNYVVSGMFMPLYKKNTGIYDVFAASRTNIIQSTVIYTGCCATLFVLLRCFYGTTSSSQSKPAKNIGICSVLTRQISLRQFFTFFQLMVLSSKNNHFWLNTCMDTSMDPLFYKCRGFLFCTVMRFT